MNTSRKGEDMQAGRRAGCRTRAVRHTDGRSRRHGLQADRYYMATTHTLFGRMPTVILSGDYLQLLLMPESSMAYTGRARRHRTSTGKGEAL